MSGVRVRVGILGKLGVGVGVGPYTSRIRNPVYYDDIYSADEYFLGATKPRNPLSSPTAKQFYSGFHSGRVDEVS